MDDDDDEMDFDEDEITMLKVRLCGYMGFIFVR